TVPIDPARVIERKSVPARLVVMLAGVTMNLVLAFAIYAGVAATVGSPQLATTQLDSVTVSALPPGAEGLAALRHGDRILPLHGAPRGPQARTRSDTPSSRPPAAAPRAPPSSPRPRPRPRRAPPPTPRPPGRTWPAPAAPGGTRPPSAGANRRSTRLTSSHVT